MCCFSRAVESVNNTRLFARPLADGRQFLVYQMTYQAREDLAMILPLPVAAGSGERAVEFVDLSGYPKFFADLKAGFPEPLSRAKPALAAGPPPAAARPKLAVVEVGDYEASFVPTVKDFDRLDERFRLPDGVWDQLPAYRQYGFAVFKLKSKATSTHPMAFSFPRAKAREIFFPTVHIHDGKVHDRAGFDHTLYCQPMPGATAGPRFWDESASLARSFMKVADAKGLVEPSQHCYRKKLTGRLANRDEIVSMT